MFGPNNCSAMAGSRFVMPPATLYHWSPRMNRESIVKHGIIPMSSREIDGWVPSYICASESPHEGWRVTAAGTAEDGDEWDLWRIASTTAAEAFEQDRHRREWRTTCVPAIGVELVDVFVAAPGSTPNVKAAVLISNGHPQK